jgi:hypothetical protein
MVVAPVARGSWAVALRIHGAAGAVKFAPLFSLGWCILG